MSNYRQGADFERSIANRLEARDMFVTRSAGSGSANRLTADIVAIDRTSVVICECKTYSGDYEGHRVNFDPEKMKEIALRVSSGSHGDVMKSKPVGMRDVYVALCLKCDDGGIPQYTTEFDTPVITGEDTEPLYELMEMVE